MGRFQKDNFLRSINAVREKAMQLTVEQALQKAVAAQKRGNLNEAENIYRAILRSEPNHPLANHNLGVIAVSLNLAGDALLLFKTALDANPTVEQFWVSYVDALVKAERPKDARQAIKKAKKNGLDAKKLGKLLSKSKRSTESDAQAHNNLGTMLQGQGHLTEAEASYLQAIALKPDFAEAHNNLGLALQGQGRLTEAEVSYNRAIALKHDFAEAHNNLGNTLQGLGKLAEAEANYNQAILLKPDDAEAHNNLGSLLEGQGKLAEAEGRYDQAISLKPDYAEAHNNRGLALHRQSRLAEAEASYNQAIALKPDYAEAHNNLGLVLQGINRLPEAEASFNQAISLKPDYPEAHNNLGTMLQGISRLTEAEDRYNQAIALKPDFAEAYRHVAQLKKLDSQDQRFLRMLELYRDDSITDEQRIHINFGLAKVHEGLKNFEQAFTHYVEGNELRKTSLHYHINQDLELFGKIKSSYSSLKSCLLKPEKLHTIARPIFIIGMPRSGTTLVEQIVSSHPIVTGAGELHYVDFFGSAIATGCSDITHEAVLNFRTRYLEKLKEYSQGNPWITDKMPLNFRYLGLLATAFPEAKFIHVKRRPEAVCWGNFETYFSATNLGYAWAIDDVVTYFRQYQNLMEFWANALQHRLYNLDYELLTDNQEPETRKLIDFIGLNWDEKCLSPEENMRNVSTASDLQVRQKVYKGSSDRWRQYEPFLDGAFEGLAST